MKRPGTDIDETIESLGPYFFIQRKAGHRLTSDTVALAEFAAKSLSEVDTVIDLGTATGAIPLILSYTTGVKHITGVEVDEAACISARKNVDANGLAARIEIIQADYRTLVDRYPEGSFSAVVSNPPYIKAGAGRVSPKKERAAGRYELFGGLGDLVKTSKHLAGQTGKIFYIFPVSRIAELLEEAQKNGLQARRLRFVHTGKDKKAAGLFLVELGCSGGLEMEGPLFL